MSKLPSPGHIVIAVGLMGFMVKAQDKNTEGPIKETGLRVHITDGNQLYAWCAVAEKTVTLDDNDGVRFSGSRDDEQAAVYCWAYINGVVDSIPAGGEFDPGPAVRLSQYVDLVTAYLKEHAAIRNRPASFLVQNAIRDAFPHR